MLRLKRISELLKASADSLEGQMAPGKAADQTATMVKELRDAAREILTSDEYQSSKIRI